MMSLLSAAVFTADALLVALLAWQTLCAARLADKGLVEAAVGWMLLALVWVVGGGAILGLIGALGRTGFLMIHLLALVALMIGRRRRGEDGMLAKKFLTAWWSRLTDGSLESRLVVVFVVALLFLGVLAAQVQPALFDALTYRLSRIGQWLQDGRIANYATDDPRINYMPVGPDLVIAWLLGATSDGFWLAPVSQLLGAALLLASTFGLARLVGLRPLPALGAATIVLGMANVAVQLTTIQSDLLTAGIFSAAYLLWHRAWLRHESSVVGAMGVALAWGCKGTLFYLAPGALLWVLWLIWQERLAWRKLILTAAVGVLAALLFVAPGYWRNMASYHSPFGPPEAVKLHHGDALTLGQHFEKLRLNLETSAVQLFDPTAQPYWCEDALRAVGQKLWPLLPAEDDRYLFLHDYPRRVLAEGILQQTDTDADIASSGMLSAVLFLAGALYAGFRSRAEHRGQIVVWSLGVMVYVLVQHFLVQWHQWAFRFAVLVAPWVGVIGAWCINQFSTRWRLAVWLITIISSVQVAFRAQWQAHQAAWQAFSHPHLGLPQFIYVHWRDWADQLDADHTKLRVALPINSPLGSFYRTDPLRPVTMEKLSELHAPNAEAAVAGTDSWLVVPAIMFMGREEKVMGTTWLYGGDHAGINSLAAYRALKPGESPLPILYQSTHAFTPNGLQRRMLVRAWKSEVKFRLTNPDTSSWRYEIKTGSIRTEGMLPPKGALEVSVEVNDRYITEVEMNFQIGDANRRPELFPGAVLMRQ